MGFCCRKSQESGSLANFRFGVVHKGSRRRIGILNRHFADIFLMLFKNLQITFKVWSSFINGRSSKRRLKKIKVTR